MVSKLLKSLYIAVVYLFLYMPLAVAIVFSFNDASNSNAWSGFTTKWYASLLHDQSLIKSAVRSLFLAASSATVSTVVGTIMAIALHRYRFIGQKVVFGSLSVIMMSPEIIQGISLAMIFIVLGIPLGFTTLLLAHTVFCFPFVTMTVLARLKGVSRTLAEAAADLGANDVSIISFFVSGKSYEILPLKIYSMVRTGIQPDVNALCAALFFVTFAVVMISYRLVRDRK